MAEGDGRAVNPWQPGADRAWGDGTPDGFDRADRTVDPDVRQFRSEESIVADRTYRRPPASVTERGPRRDLLVERDVLADINQLPEADRFRAVQHMQALARDVPGSEGILLTTLPNDGRMWRDSPFALVTRGLDDQQRDLFQQRLRAALSPSPHNDIVPVAQVEGDLRALPREMKAPALQAIDALAQASPSELKKHETVFTRADGLGGTVRILPLGENHTLIYHHQPPAWGSSSSSQELPDANLGKFSAPRRPAESLPGRGTVQLLAVCDNNTELGRLADDRATALPHGHMVYRVLPGHASPTGREAVQVLAMQVGASVDVDRLTERVYALQASISEHRERTRTTTRLEHSPDVAVVPVASRNTAADNGITPPRPARLATVAGTVTESFDKDLARALSPDRRWDFVVHPQAVQELRELPTEVKAAAFGELQDLAFYGPSSQDVKRQPPGQPTPPSPASAQAVKDFDLSQFRPRYVLGGDGQPTHQIVYRAVPAPAVYRQRAGQRVTGVGESIRVPVSIPDPGPGARLDQVLESRGPSLRIDGTRDPDSRPLIVITAVRPWPNDPDVAAVVADRSPQLNRESLQQKQARPSRVQPAEPGLGYQVVELALRPTETAQQMAERVHEQQEARLKERQERRAGPPNPRQQAATRRSATASAPPIPQQPRPTLPAAPPPQARPTVNRQR
ncbi:hypothetical protein ACQPYK_49435 (plasmid) [Streptosporangium sp. CA-135522]|uniref:hypothetical protein n=1 Tax=Streptosporangium sp. CA-135522 TaxID=3240072 RepID=UPI003D89D5CE